MRGAPAQRRRSPSRRGGRAAPAQPVARRPNGEVDYHHLERPAVIRRRNLGNTALAQEHDADYLDVPAFLRQQAD